MAKSIKSQLSFLGKTKKLTRMKVDFAFDKKLDYLERMLDSTISLMNLYTEKEWFLRASQNKTLTEFAEIDYSKSKMQFDNAAGTFPDLKKLEGLFNYYYKTIFQICDVDVSIKGPVWSKEEVQKFNDEHPIIVITKELIVPELDRLIQKDKFGDDGDEYTGIPDPDQKEKVEKQFNLLLNEVKEIVLKNGTIKQTDLDRATKKHFKLIQEEIDYLETVDRDRFYRFNYDLATFLNLKMVR